MQKPDTCKGCPFYEAQATMVRPRAPVSKSTGGDMIVVFSGIPTATEAISGTAIPHETLLRYLERYTTQDVNLIYFDHAVRCRGPEKPKPTATLAAVRHCKVHDPKAYTDGTVKKALILGPIAQLRVNPSLKFHDWRGHELPAEGEESA